MIDFDKKGFLAALICWYRQYGRDLLWRHTKNPYYIWLSEIMLQQTQVETVKPYYQRFIECYPTVEALAQASVEDVYKLWEGLGYYRRAAHLKEAAMTISGQYGGHFPVEYEQLLTLKGIGSYTASAIASIAFDQPKGVIDGNTLRIISRIFNCQDNIAKDSTKKAYQKIMDEWVADTSPSDFNQGMMDLGAMICTPKNPDCEHCPVQSFCQAYKNHTQKLLPVNIRNRNKTDLYYITGLISYQQKYFIIKNKEGLLTDLYGLVQYPAESPKAFEAQFMAEFNLPVQLKAFDKDYKHVFTHRVWHMSVYLGDIDDHTLSGEQKKQLLKQMYSKEELQQLPVPTAHKKILESCGIL